ncbi:DnaA ATPase domain-containing protein [Stakelama saccharophila]|uniref:DnaA/Hda family protein n=1 Tax=Stakelama saccharophila TaxID=3075605 RepID=A0ABZ0B6P3_9SPHN|nr:DnaA/Hda family protein [Stakelama sp. W311]WNO52553.1 DnaA/Hda family protein [Stakelama sp. W311]
MAQLDLPLGWPADASEGEFVVGEANARAVHHLEHRGSWPLMATILAGPRKSGRSLLGRIFAAHSGGTLIDDAEREDEEALFHAWNRAQMDRRPLLMIADAPPPEWKVQLSDLRTRLTATPVVRIGDPDDALMRDLLHRYLERRRIVVRPEVVDWIAARTERSYVALWRVVDALEDGLEGRRGRRLSIPVARATLADAGLHSDEISADH